MHNRWRGGAKRRRRRCQHPWPGGGRERSPAPPGPLQSAGRGGGGKTCGGVPGSGFQPHMMPMCPCAHRNACHANPVRRALPPMHAAPIRLHVPRPLRPSSHAPHCAPPPMRPPTCSSSGCLRSDEPFALASHVPLSPSTPLDPPPCAPTPHRASGLPPTCSSGISIRSADPSSKMISLCRLRASSAAKRPASAHGRGISQACMHVCMCGRRR